MTEIHFGVRDFRGFHTCRLLARFLWSTKSLDYGIACHVPSHPTTLIRWTTLDKGTSRGHVSLHDVFLVGWVIEGGLLRSTERDPEGSEDRWSTSLQSLTFGSLRVSLGFPSGPCLDLSPRVPSIHDQDLLWLAELRGNCASLYHRIPRLSDNH
jgi:hypothetical protein